MISFCRDCVYKSRLLRGILVQHAVTCVYVAHSTLADESWIMFRVARQEGEFPNQLIKCLEMLRQAFFKTNEEREIHQEPHPVSLAGSNFTSSKPGAELNFRPFFLLSSSIHTFICPISRPLVNQLAFHLLGTCTSQKSEFSHCSHSRFFFYLLSSIRRPPCYL